MPLYHTHTETVMSTTQVSTESRGQYKAKAYAAADAKSPLAPTTIPRRAHNHTYPSYNRHHNSYYRHKISKLNCSSHVPTRLTHIIRKNLRATSYQRMRKNYLLLVK